MDFSSTISPDAGVFSNLLLIPRQPPSSAPAIAISAVCFLATDSAAVRSDRHRASPVPRALVRRTRRTRRKSLDASDDGFSGDGDGDDGPFGGGGSGGGGGKGWGFGWSEGSDWEEESGRNSADPAFDFVYEVVLWIALSNCTHFAFKKIGRILEEREKVVPIGLVC